MNRHLRLLYAALVCMLPAQAAEAGEIQGTVIAVQGDNVTLRVETIGTLRPAVGDRLSISQRPNEDGNALGIAGPWTVTEVKGDLVKVTGDGSSPGVRPWANMAAVIAMDRRRQPEPETRRTGLLQGTVIAVQGTDVTVKIQPSGTLRPSVGDALDVLEDVHGGIGVFDLGNWKITEVKGDIVKAKAIALESDSIMPKVKMMASIHVLPRPDHGGGPPDNTTVKKVGGKVIMVRGKNVTIKPEPSEVSPARDDAVELSFSVPPDKILVGTWRVSSVRKDGLVEAEPVKAEGKPSVGMDAVITVKRQGASEPEPRLRVPSLNASVAGVRFFEGPKDLPPLKERIYSTVFSESRARFIDWELHLKYPKPGRTIDFVVHYRYYDNKGILLTKYDVNTHIEATWTSSYHAGGCKAKPWAPGTYRADFYIAGDKVASGTFEVVSE